MAAWATENENRDEALGNYEDGMIRPKKVKELSDKRKRAVLLKGNPNPASQMRENLQVRRGEGWEERSDDLLLLQHNN